MEKINTDRRNLLLGTAALIASKSIPAAADILIENNGQKDRKEVMSTPQHAEVVPEYERTMKEFLLTYADPKGEDTYAHLIMSLPKYTHLQLVIGRAPSAQNFATRLQDYAYSRGLSVSTSVQDAPLPLYPENTDPWAEDMLEAGVDPRNGKMTFIIPNTHLFNSAFSKSKVKHRLRRIKEYAESTHTQVTEAPFYFEGGDVTISRLPDGQKCAFIGKRSIARTQTMLQILCKRKEYPKEMCATEAKKEALELFQKFFVDTKIILMDTSLPKAAAFAFHIDQSFLCIDDKTLLFMQPEKVTHDPKMLQLYTQQKEYRKILKNLGYTIIDVPHSKEDCQQYKSSLNTIIYTDKNTSKKHALFPVYPGEFTQKKPGALILPHQLQGKAKIMYNILLKQGVTPQPVIDNFFYTQGGSIHCISNTLALNETDLKQMKG